jgi:hypothetical protein
MPEVLVAGWTPLPSKPSTALGLPPGGKRGELALPSPTLGGCGEALGRRGEGADGGTTGVCDWLGGADDGGGGGGGGRTVVVLGRRPPTAAGDPPPPGVPIGR